MLPIGQDSFIQPALNTLRFALEPITEIHAKELCEFFGDNELHHFVPFESPTLEQQTGRIAAHIQAGMKADRIASIGYVVGRAFQRRGCATECLESVFKYLGESLGALEVKAWSDTRNEASHRLAQKLGMVQVELIKDADFFKGSTSDEFVFSKVFKITSQNEMQVSNDNT